MLVFGAFFLLVHSQFRDSLTRARIRLWRLRRCRYAVVCGLGWKGCELARQLILEGTQVVGIDLDTEDSSIIELRRKGLAVFQGDTTVESVLKKAGIRNAHEIYVMTSSDEINGRVAMQINHLFTDEVMPDCLKTNTPKGCGACSKTSDVICYVNMESYRRRIFLEQIVKNSPLRIHCFNLTEMGIRSLLRQHGLIPVAAEGRSWNVHCVVVGAGAVSQVVLQQCLRMLHLRPEQKRVITVLCRDAEREAAQFYFENPCLRPDGQSAEMRRVAQGLFPELEFVEMPSSNADLLADGFALYRHINAGWRVNVFFCEDRGMGSVSLMEMVQPRLDFLAQQAGASCDVRTFCHFNYPESAGDLAETKGVEFGSYSETCQPGFIRRWVNDGLAKGILKNFSTKQFAAWGEEPDARTACYLDRLWLHEPEWSRESNRQAADHMFVKLALTGCSPDADGISRFERQLTESAVLEELAVIEHNRWCAERLLGGWLPLSPNDDLQRWHKDEVYQKTLKKKLRRSACLVPFAELTSTDKTKDHRMIKMIPALLGSLPEMSNG